MRMLVCLLAGMSFAAGADLSTVHESFDADPGWVGVQNRMVCTDCPEKRQDFGWHAPEGQLPGRIGGRIENSRYQAYYAMPLGKPLTFQDAFSASGTVSMTRLGFRGVGYFGFFNSSRHTWRPWSSMAIRIWEEDRQGQVMMDYMNSRWEAGGYETDVFLPGDGRAVPWRLTYDPEARPATAWRYPQYESVVPGESESGIANQPPQLEENLWAKAREIEPELTRETFRARLEELRADGLITYFHRHGFIRWWKVTNPEKYHGKITLQFDGTTHHVYMPEAMRSSPVEMDRFGIFNIQRFGDGIELYLGDLEVNGQAIDLAQDPHWEGRNNRASYIEPDFHSMHDFGYSQTNWAGERPGEVGGLMWRTEPPDPHFAYYAADVGKLTFDNPIAFSGTLCFVEGMTDAAMFIGYFDSVGQTAVDMRDGNVESYLGIRIADASAVGYWFHGYARAKGNAEGNPGVPITPTRARRRFTFAYTPSEQCGEVVYTLDDEEFRFEVTADQRAAGAVFDRFGLMNVRSGGHSVEVYFDDLTYTSALPPDERVHHKQELTPVSYPAKNAGRQY